MSSSGVHSLIISSDRETPAPVWSEHSLATSITREWERARARAILAGEPANREAPVSDGGALRSSGVPTYVVPPPPLISHEAQAAAALADALLKTRLGRVGSAFFSITKTLTRRSRLWPGILYVIRRHGTVEIVDRGRRTARLCLVVSQEEPEADRIMTILDMIETDETKLWEMGNIVCDQPPTPPERA